jgi:hypothetical protein
MADSDVIDYDLGLTKIDYINEKVKLSVELFNLTNTEIFDKFMFYIDITGTPTQLGWWHYRILKKKLKRVLRENGKDK